MPIPILIITGVLGVLSLSSGTAGSISLRDGELPIGYAGFGLAGCLAGFAAFLAVSF